MEVILRQLTRLVISQEERSAMLVPAHLDIYSAAQANPSRVLALDSVQYQLNFDRLAAEVTVASVRRWSQDARNILGMGPLDPNTVAHITRDLEQFLSEVLPTPPAAQPTTPEQLIASTRRDLLSNGLYIADLQETCDHLLLLQQEHKIPLFAKPIENYWIMGLNYVAAS